MTVGFIGLGHMGEPSAFNLLNKGIDLIVYDRRREAADRLVAAGATWAGSIAELAAAAQTVVTCVPGPPEVQAVVAGEGGLMESLGAGRAWIDMSTTDLHQMAAFAKAFAGKGVEVLETTATGGVQAAWQGHVILFVGGDPAVFERRRAVIDGIADRVFYCGPMGSATVTKLITNTLCFVHQTALGEVLMLGRKAGLDISALLEAIQASYGGSFVADVDGPQILDGSYDFTFDIGLVAKDARLAMGLAREFGAPMRVAGVVSQIVEEALARYGPKAGALVATKALEEDIGVSLRAPWPKEGTSEG
jgi:3-hydroxyisobutyrate dehydrogenase